MHGTLLLLAWKQLEPNGILINLGLCNVIYSFFFQMHRAVGQFLEELPK